MKQIKMQFSRMSVVVLILLCWTGQGFALSDEALKQGVPSLAPMLEKVTPAVVSIVVSKSMPVNNRLPFDRGSLPEEFQRFFDDRQGEQPQSGRNMRSGAGSGVIVDGERGMVVTNHHVVDGASEISVILNNGERYTGKLIGSDARTDVALVQIDAKNLSELKLADIHTVRVGDYAVAIGNPFGIGQTVTSGIVSALGRAGLNNDNYEDFIQTDAAINQGNSGGALVDLEGNLIGINTAIISGDGGSNGIGFAVPANMVAIVIHHLETDGEVRRGLLGVQISDLNSQVREALNIKTEAGALVTQVVPGSAAEKAGVQVSDVITAFNGEKITGSRELRNAVGLMRQGNAVNLMVNRNGENLNLQATIAGDGGETLALEQNSAISPSNFRGAQLSDQQPNDKSDAGITAVEVEPGSPAWQAGLRKGDVIVELNRKEVFDLEGFNALAQKSNEMIALTIQRNGQPQILLLPAA